MSSAGRRIRGATALAWALALLAPATGPSAAAATHGVRLRWAPSVNAAVAGYHVYVRRLDGAWGRPLDAGLPSPESDGALAWTARGIDAGDGHAFAVAAYMESGTESALSNEIALAGGPCSADADCADTDACTVDERCEGGTCVHDGVECPAAGPCTVGTCDPASGCAVAVLPDGSACDTADPCEPGVCAAGSCAAPAGAEARASSHALAVSRFRIRTSGRRTRVAGKASFALAPGVDPSATGVVVELRRGDGTVLWAATVPGLRRRGGRRTTRYGTGHARSASTGLTKLVLKARRGTADVTMAASVAGIGSETRLAWVIRLGDECVRDPDLECAATGRAITCE